MPKTFTIVASGSAIYNRHSYNPGTNGLKHILNYLHFSVLDSGVVIFYFHNQIMLVSRSQQQ